MPPKAQSFKTSYAEKPENIDADSLDSSLRSYMDSGEDYFDDETFDGKRRNDIITQVRANILKRMKQENAASGLSATTERAKHAQYSAKILRKIADAKKIQRDIRKSDIEYAALQGKEHVNDRAFALKYLNDLISNAQQDLIAERQTLTQGQLTGANAEIEGQEEVEDELNQGFVQEGQDEDDWEPEAPVNQSEQDEAQENWLRQRNLGLVESQRGRSAKEVSQQGIDERVSDLEYLLRMKAEVERTNASKSSKLGRFFRAVSLRSSVDRSNNAGRRRDFQHKIEEANAVAVSWIRERDNYAQKTYKVHYDNYDKMAKSWYEMTQGYSVGPNGELPQDMVNNRTIPVDSEKAIVEYTGVYDEAALGNLLNRIADNPYMNVADLPIKESKKTNGDAENGGNEADVLNHVKIHKKIAMYSQAGENGLKTRFKFKRNFMGHKSKRQFTANSPTALQVMQNTGADFFNEVYAGRAGLESDELDINGRKLYSEKSAEVLHAKLKRNGQKVHGFYLNGEFYSDEVAGQGQDVAGKKDLKYFGRRNFDKQEKAEKLRTAIRKSAFFQHVNAATIQHYASYNSGTDYTEDIQEAVEKKWQEAEEKDENNSKDRIVNTLTENPNTMRNIPEDLRGVTAYEYIKRKLANPNGHPFNVANPTDDPVIKFLMKVEAKGALLMVMTCLLSDDTPSHWAIARKMVTKTDVVADRTKIKLEKLPENGQMMRMGLLDELINHQKLTSEFDWDDVTSFIKPTRLSVYEEELENKRGVGAWFKRNLLNGNIIKQVISTVGLGFDVSDQISDIGGALKDSEWELDSDVKESRDERKCWFLYGEAMAEGSMLSGLLGGAGALIGLKKGGAEGAAKGRDIYFQAADAIGMIGDIKAIYDMIKGALKKFYNKFIKKKTDEERQEEEREKADALQDLDMKTLRSVLKFLTHILNLADGIRDVASYHVDADPEKGKWEGWGNLLQWKGPLQWVFDTARNLISVVNDIAEIYVTTKRIKRIDSADKDIETAMANFVANGNGDDIQIPENQQQSEDGFEIINPEAEAQRDQLKEQKKMRQLGEAASENSQAQYFMALTKAQSRKSRSAAGFDMASSFLKMGRDTMKQFAKSGEPVSMIITAALMVAPKIVDFIGWTVGKLKYDRQNFKDNIASMLGSKDYAKTPYFDKVLKRETGIISSDYLVDVARIFTSIDTHFLIQKDGKSEGELDLAKKVVGTLYGNVTDTNIKKVELDTLLKYSGFSGDSDWRALLRNAIKA